MATRGYINFDSHSRRVYSINPNNYVAELSHISSRSLAESIAE
jgi:hypothetical protein